MAETERDDALADVRAAMDQISKGAGGAPQPQDTAADSTASPPGGTGKSGDPEAALDNVAAAPERARDPETGKFIKAAPQTAAADPAPVKATPEVREAVQPAPSTAPTGKPPPGWSPEAKAAWATLTPALQQAVIKREQEVSDGFRQKSDELRRLQEIDGIIAPRRPYYQRFGFKSDAEAINHLLTLSDSMERDAAGTIAHLAQHYRVDLARLTGGQPQLQQQQPQIQPPPQNIETLIDEKIALRDAKMIVQEFEHDPPEHYQAVKPLMKQLLEIGQAKDMQDAYDKALWMTPELREQLLEAKQAEAQAKLQAAVAPKVDRKLKASNASLSGAPHGTPSGRPLNGSKGAFGEVTDDVRAAIAQLTG